MQTHGREDVIQLESAKRVIQHVLSVACAGEVEAYEDGTMLASLTALKVLSLPTHVAPYCRTGACSARARVQLHTNVVLLWLRRAGYQSRVRCGSPLSQCYSRAPSDLPEVVHCTLLILLYSMKDKGIVEHLHTQHSDHRGQLVSSLLESLLNCN